MHVRADSAEFRPFRQVTIALSYRSPVDGDVCHPEKVVLAERHRKPFL
jgi:hypothetical protein